MYLVIPSVVCLMLFQNCARPAGFTETASLNSLGRLAVCNGISCDLDPLTSRPAVTTVLMALGDEANDQLVVKGASAQLIAETVVRYTSPRTTPKILLVRDFAAGNEHPEDIKYVREVLLKRYDVTLLQEPSSGLTDQMLVGYDVVWFANPGSAMGSVKTRDALLRFTGGVVLEGDDMARGGNFDNEKLTGLKYKDNGTSVKCQGVDYAHDNNLANQYRVSMDPTKIPGATSDAIEFRYGNDIDNTSVARNDLEILASARGGPAACTETRPVIVRYLK